ncbi:DNA polymerase III subunit beta [Candidatus Riesia pediculischaeffi]|uniref:Beta sliding clamp n=1 Tax=Candidatus Riesia pediculischaeffi PTSU TaxID=1401651 RepID=A0A0C1VJA9_9ENTR|nr:DNA polymerase III subunit beta [Candidatus Riesia pediculischaeffi]KIE63925.1 DNA polymerase III beta subunit [Candidatus Riesia pediculischaeffi PTSU]
MKFVVQKEVLIKSLKKVYRATSNKIANFSFDKIFLHVQNSFLNLTYLDSEVTIVTKVKLVYSDQDGSIVVSIRKFYEICSNAQNGSEICFVFDEKKLTILYERSKFSILIFRESEFPKLINWTSQVDFRISQIELRKLILSTKVSIGSHDTRYYLNGILLQNNENYIRAVSTDGHRLSVSQTYVKFSNYEKFSIILSKRGVVECLRLLENSDNLLRVSIGKKDFKMNMDDFSFCVKLVNGNFPNYQDIFLKTNKKVVVLDRIQFKNMCQRAMILLNDKNQSACFVFESHLAKITTKNFNHGEYEETIKVQYQDSIIKICLNVKYVLDVLNIIQCERIKIEMIDSISYVRIQGMSNQLSFYVIMPVRI